MFAGSKTTQPTTSFTLFGPIFCSEKPLQKLTQISKGTVEVIADVRAIKRVSCSLGLKTHSEQLPSIFSPNFFRQTVATIILQCQMHPQGCRCCNWDQGGELLAGSKQTQRTAATIFSDSIFLR